MSTWQQRSNSARLDLLSSPIMRAAGWTTAALLLSGYLTGEEVQHTHASLGYGLGAVLAAYIFWEIMRPLEYRVASVRDGVDAARAAFSGANSSSVGGPALLASALMLLVGFLAVVALAMLWIAHSFLPAVGVDEAHEAIAYLSLGLTIFYLGMVIVGTSQQIFRLFRVR